MSAQELPPDLSEWLKKSLKETYGAKRDNPETDILYAQLLSLLDLSSRRLLLSELQNFILITYHEDTIVSLPLSDEVFFALVREKIFTIKDLAAKLRTDRKAMEELIGTEIVPKLNTKIANLLKAKRRAAAGLKDRD